MGFGLNGRSSGTMPNLLLLRGENGRLSEQSADAITADLASGMEPAKEAHAAEALWQDMLKKAADELGGLQRHGLVLSGVGVTIRPEHLPRGQQL